MIRGLKDKNETPAKILKLRRACCQDRWKMILEKIAFSIRNKIYLIRISLDSET